MSDPVWCELCCDHLEAEPSGVCPSDCGQILDYEKYWDFEDAQREIAIEIEMEEKWRPSPLGLRHNSVSGMPWWR